VFPSTATHARKYVTNAMTAGNVADVFDETGVLIIIHTPYTTRSSDFAI